jgi:C1A family cysteine protease
MNMQSILFGFLLCYSISVFSKTLSSNDQYSSPYEKNPIFVAIEGQLKAFGPFSEKENHPNKEIKKEEVVVKPKELSRGQKLIEEAKAKNRAILQAKNEGAKTKENTDEGMSDLDKLKMEHQKGLDEMKSEADKNLSDWKDEIRKQREIWKDQQDIFYGRIKVYKENTFVLPVKKEKIVETKLADIKMVEKLPEHFVVANAFDVAVRDQVGRPTCAAFAGVRAIDILLAQNNLKKETSTQYLYWASKPKCHSSPCSEKGSWVTAGFNYSKNQMKPDIPLEKKCKYKIESLPTNETQLPLPVECKEGIVKIEAYEEVKTLSDVVLNLKKNYPVIMGAKLSGNFYQNEGLVTLADSKKNFGIKLDGHAQGHAFVAVGFHELPLKLKASEGDYCLIIANSWGEGFGSGGYACLTENWLKQFRIPAPFIAVTKVVAQD